MSNSDIEKIFRDVNTRFNFVKSIDRRIEETSDWKKEKLSYIEPSYCLVNIQENNKG
jgi:hypothetical protein